MRGLMVSAGMALVMAGSAAAAELSVTMNRIDASGVGEAIGTVTISDGDAGAVLTTDLRDLPPGERGFHLHQNPDCGPGENNQGQVVAGQAAGGHWDPHDTGEHHGPEGEGHLGDLPALPVAEDGTAQAQLTAPRIDDVEQLRGRALMIHAGGDNYADEPEPLGGGGGRIACGVIQ